MDGLKGGCGCALPLSLFLQLRHFHCIRHANGADIHFGKREREREYRTMGYSPISIHILGHSVCLSATSKFHHWVERTAHLQSEMWGGICTTWKKRIRERRKDSSVCPLLPRVVILTLSPPSPSLSPSLSHQGQKGPRRSPARCCRNSHGFATMNECMMHIWSAI